MSTDPSVNESEKVKHGGQEEGAEKVQHDEKDNTPRSEVPIAVKILSPSTASDTTTRPAPDYFTSVPGTADEQQQQLPALSRTRSATPAPSVSTSASDVTANGQLHLPEGTLLQPPEQQQRPAAQTHVSSLSVESTDSSATVRASNGQGITTGAPTPRRPVFPNQAYSALQSQHYPVRQHAPPVLRQRSSHPGQILTFTSAVASVHQSGTRTVGNSPAVTPGAGLFTPNTAPPTDEYESPETPGTYASPFLHFTQRQAPRETHVADVDVDPISGRKLINHYEVVDELGRGTHGKVKLGRDLQTENTYVAIKIVERYSKRRKLGKLVSAAEDKVKKEVAILKKARHPNIVALLEVIDDPTRKKVYIVLEWVERGEIQWRTKTSKEIAMVEARRYERERSGKRDRQTAAEDEAVGLEAQRRLAREHRRRTREHRRQVRRMLNEGSEVPESWSHELGGDEESDTSEDDRMSRASTGATTDSASNRLFAESRRQSRTPSPLPPIDSAVSPNVEHSHHPPLTSEPQTMSPVAMRADIPTFVPNGLEGTMYGSYAWSSSQSSRVNSLANSAYEQIDPEEVKQLAGEILDSELNPELEYCPILTLQQARVAFRDTLLGLQYLHHQGIVHRDIKPPNLLQTNDHRVKISDFGVSYLGRPLDEGDAGEDVSEHEAQDFDEAKELAKTVGTPAFYAPELCITEPGEDPLPVTKAIDVWALGVTLFCMLFARTPFVDNEFVMMRQIADEDVYIPRTRLMPVHLKPASRPSSHSRVALPQPVGRRGELDLLYEEIDDDLYDLLKRLLVKDPRKRITLDEVRHHPWVVADVPNTVKWLEETDPARPSQGKKIEISNEDVKSAVVPLQFLDRVRSGIKKVTDRLGFSSSGRAGRGRAPSNAGLPGAPSSASASPSASAGSSSSTLNQDQRRHSLRGDEDIYSALKASRQGERSHGEHPLAKSVAASPELERNETYFDKYSPNAETSTDDLRLHPTPPRPSPPERSKTMMSTAGSIRTLKQSDVARGRESPPPSPGLPGTPVALQSPGGHSLQAILGSGPARRAFKSLRERSTPRGPETRGRSPDRESLHSVDAHGEPTLALSQTSAEGQVSLPQALQEIEPNGSVPSSIQNSPVGSRAPSVVASPHDRLQPVPNFPAILSRNSSGGSIRSLGGLPPAQAAAAELSRSPVQSRPQSRTAPESSAEDWQRADDERIRKLIREGKDNIERPPSAFDDRTCPPSPDDQRVKRRESRQMSIVDISNPVSPHETSPTGHITQLPSAMVSSSSDFGSAVSMSISNPSIPSVISEASSVDLADGMPIEELEAKRNASSGDTLNPLGPVPEEVVDEGYSPDREQPLNSEDEDDFDSSSDSDGGLVMSRRKSKTSNHGNGDSLAAALEKANAKERRGTGLSARSKKSSRSGSNNTMKKVRTRDSEDERRRSSSNELREE